MGTTSSANRSRAMNQKNAADTPAEVTEKNTVRQTEKSCGPGRTFAGRKRPSCPAGVGAGSFSRSLEYGYLAERTAKRPGHLVGGGNRRRHDAADHRLCGGLAGSRRSAGHACGGTEKFTRMRTGAAPDPGASSKSLGIGRRSDHVRSAGKQSGGPGSLRKMRFYIGGNPSALL